MSCTEQLILENFSAADLLLGKPIPAQVAHAFYAQNSAWTNANIQWLIDTKERLLQYLEIAKDYAISLHVNIEIDVGLHRGGVQSETQFAEMLSVIQQYPQYLKLSGLMGYDAHVTKIPSIIKKPDQAYQESQQIYLNYQKVIQTQFPALWNSDLCFNGGGRARRTPVSYNHSGGNQPQPGLSVL